MSDTIFITGVVIHARHGVMEHETEVGQRFVIDLELLLTIYLGFAYLHRNRAILRSKAQSRRHAVQECADFAIQRHPLGSSLPALF